MLLKARLLVLITLLALLAVACSDNRTAPPPPTGVTTTAGEGGPVATTAVEGGSGAVVVDPAMASAGGDLFDGSCVACHGAGGVGIEGLGKALTNSEFVQGLGDAELIDFIAVGRLADDPENTTGVAMPAKGGNPSLSDDDLASIVAYLRTLN